MKKAITVILIIMLIAITGSIYAATGKITLEPDNDLLKKGETFTVTVKGEASDKITAMQANLVYEKTKLEMLDESAPGENFSDLSSGDEISVITTKAEGMAKSKTLYKVKFKVLETALDGDAKIELKDATISVITDDSAQENVENINSEITIKIKSADEENNNNNNNNNDNNNNNNNNSNNNAGSNNDTNNNNIGNNNDDNNQNKVDNTNNINNPSNYLISSRNICCYGNRKKGRLLSL